jgi:hypothetical protein
MSDTTQQREGERVTVPAPEMAERVRRRSFSALKANPRRFKGRLPKPGQPPEAVRINPPPPDPPPSTFGPGTGSTDTADSHATNRVSSRVSGSRCGQSTPPDHVRHPTTTEGGKADEARENRVMRTGRPEPLGPLVPADPGGPRSSSTATGARRPPRARAPGDHSARTCH